MATKRNDVSVKIDAEAVRVAKIVAAYEDKSLAEYLSNLVLEHAIRELEIKQSAGSSLPKRKPKGSK